MQKSAEKKALSPLAQLEARLAKRPGYRKAKAQLGTVATVAAKLIRYRQDHGLSQAELAAKAGVSRKALNEIEGLVNTNPSLKTLEGIASALGVSVSELFS